MKTTNTTWKALSAAIATKLPFILISSLFVFAWVLSGGLLIYGLYRTLIYPSYKTLIAIFGLLFYLAMTLLVIVDNPIKDLFKDDDDDYI